MRSWSAVWLVAGRELREAARRRSYWIVAGIVLAGSIAAMVLPEVIGGDETPRYQVATVDVPPSVAPLLERAVTAIDGRLELRSAASADAARRLVEDGEVDVGVLGGDVPTILVKADQHDRLVGAVHQALATADATRRLEAAGLSRAAVQDILDTPPARIELLDTAGADRRGAAFMLSLGMYLLLLMLMVLVANGTAVEKANRISEVLLAIVRPGALLFGKVIGVGLLGLVTLACGVVPVIVKLAAGGDLPAGLGGALVGGGAWLVLGAALYLVLAGSLGALVERQEEAGSVVSPLSLTLLAAYLIGGSAPESPVARVLAYIPFTSPMVMPSRIAVGAASGVEMAVSLLLGVAAVVVAVRVGSEVYRRAIVRTGRRLRFGEVLRSA